MNSTYMETLCAARIPWSLWSAPNNIADLTAGEASTDWPFGSERHENWGPRAKWLLGAWLGHLNLDRSDVITVLTTSQECYVAIDVSVTSFNFASVSRVVTDRTRVIIVIHELGYVDKEFPSRCKEWRARGIVVMEDCAHVAGVEVGSQRVGDFGDAALFSLTKVIPARVGGLIRTRKPFQLPAMDETLSAAAEEGKAAAMESFPYLYRINALREERHQLLRRGLGLSPWEPEARTYSAPLYSIYTDSGASDQQIRIPERRLGTDNESKQTAFRSPQMRSSLCAEFEALIAHVRS